MVILQDQLYLYVFLFEQLLPFIEKVVCEWGEVDNNY